MTRQPKTSKSQTPTRHITIGYALTAAREEHKVSLVQAAHETKIKAEQLARFESGRFALQDTYQRGLLDSYARYLELNPAALFEADVDKPPKRRNRSKPTKPVVRRHFKKKKAVVASTSAKRSLATAFVSVAVGGILLLVFIFFSAPRLTVNGLEDVTYTDDTSITIEGSTSSGSEVFINSTPVLVTPEGTFTQRVFLNSGPNVITIEAVNSLSQTARQEKIVVAEYPPFD